MKMRMISKQTNIAVAVLFFIVSIAITCVITTKKAVAIATEALNMYEEREYISEQIQDVQEYIMMDIQVRKDELIELDDTYAQMMEIGGHNSGYLEQYQDIDLWLDDYEGVVRIVVTEKSENIEGSYYVPKKTTTILSKELDVSSTTKLYSSQDEYMLIVEKNIENNIEKNILKVGIIFIGVWVIIVVAIVIIKRIKRIKK